MPGGEMAHISLLVIVLIITAQTISSGQRYSSKVQHAVADSR
jgi:hypothetical protein